jgi:hypothetical protein
LCTEGHSEKQINPTSSEGFDGNDYKQLCLIFSEGSQCNALNELSITKNLKKVCFTHTELICWLFLVWMCLMSIYLRRTNSCIDFSAFHFSVIKKVAF